MTNFNFSVPDRRLPPRLNRILPSSGLLSGVSWFETDVSGLAGPLNIVPRDSPETSALNQVSPLNNPADGKIQLILQIFRF